MNKYYTLSWQQNEKTLVKIFTIHDASLIKI